MDTEFNHQNNSHLGSYTALLQRGLCWSLFGRTNTAGLEASLNSRYWAGEMFTISSSASSVSSMLSIVLVIAETADLIPPLMQISSLYTNTFGESDPFEGSVVLGYVVWIHSPIGHRDSFTITINNCPL
jgi:hypothetical protein